MLTRMWVATSPSRSRLRMPRVITLATGVQVTDGGGYHLRVGNTLQLASAGVWSVGTLASGASSTLTIVATATAAARPSLPNTAEVNGELDADKEILHPTTTSPRKMIRRWSPRSRSTLTNMVDNAAPYVGSNVIFTVTVANAAGFRDPTGCNRPRMHCPLG